MRMPSFVYWWIGLVFLLLGAVGNIVSVGYGNLILLASSSAITMIFNLLLSVSILQESFSLLDAISILVICLGSISCMLMSKENKSNYTSAEIFRLYTTTASCTLYICSALYLIATHRMFMNLKENVTSSWATIVKTYHNKRTRKLSLLGSRKIIS